MRRATRWRSIRAETCTMPQPIKAVSELISSAQRLWFRGGIAERVWRSGLRGKRRLQWNTRRIDLFVFLPRLLYRLLFLFCLLPQSLCFLGHSMRSSTGRHGSVDLSACESSKPSAYGRLLRDRGCDAYRTRLLRTAVGRQSPCVYGKSLEPISKFPIAVDPL